MWHSFHYKEHQILEATELGSQTKKRRKIAVQYIHFLEIHLVRLDNLVPSVSHWLNFCKPKRYMLWPRPKHAQDLEESSNPPLSIHLVWRLNWPSWKAGLIQTIPNLSDKEEAIGRGSFGLGFDAPSSVQKLWAVWTNFYNVFTWMRQSYNFHFRVIFRHSVF